jgi:DNA-binding response OmpR family regulator
MKAKTILIIEDEAALLEMYTKKFKNAGYKVTNATDGITGIETALKEQPSIVLIDLFIPKKDGIEVLTELRPKLKDSKLVIATNLDQPEKEKEAMSKGSDAYILKARYLPSEIVTLITDLL